MQNLPGLMAFIEAAACGSFSGAAQRLDLTPAAVSKSVARLEAQLGVRLFNRSTRRLALTDEARPFLERARSALRTLDEALAEVSRAARVPAGRVRISVGMAFGRRWVLPALPTLAVAHPQLQLEVDLENRPVDLVAQGYDIGIRGGLIEDSSLVARRVCAMPLALLASPGYLRRAGVPAQVDDLAAHRCAVVRFADGHSPPWCFGRGARARVLQPAAALKVSDPEALVDLALADAGIVQTALHHALPYLRSGRLKLLLPGLHDSGDREVVLHYPHRHHLAPRVRTVVEALLAHFAQADDLQCDVAEALRRWPTISARTPQALEVPPVPKAAAAATPRGGPAPRARPGGRARTPRSP